MELELHVLPKDFQGELSVGDIYWAEFLQDWMICLPIPREDRNQYRQFIEFALNTCASTCPHPDKPNRHRCWDVTGDKELENGDASKLTIHPSILITYEPNKTIHGFVTSGVWRDC